MSRHLIVEKKKNAHVTVSPCEVIYVIIPWICNNRWCLMRLTIKNCGFWWKTELFCR